MLACAGPNGVVMFDVANRTFVEIGRIDSQTSIDAVAFSPDSQQMFLARQREPLVRPGDGGLEKLFDPSFTSVTMTVREGTSSGVTFNTKVKSAKSLTGGSNIEAWQIKPRTAAQDVQTWNAFRTYFDDKPDDARKILEQVIKDHPNYGEAQRIYAIFFERQDLNKLQSRLEAAVKADPTCISCLRTLGDVQFKTEHELDAARSYEQVLKLKPEYGLVAGHLAEVYGKIGLDLSMSENTSKTMKAAEEALTRALKLRPAEERFYTNLGAAYYFRSEFDKDINLLLIAKRLRPDHARVYYNLGHAYRYKGDKKKAIEAYSRYVQMGEKGEEARVEKAKAYIAELSK